MILAVSIISALARFMLLNKAKRECTAAVGTCVFFFTRVLTKFHLRRYKVKRIALVLSLIGLVAVGSGFAGQATAEVLKAKIDFQFTAGGKVLPAGMYDFMAINNDAAIRVQGEGKNSAIVSVITRLAGDIHTTPQDAHLVFDEVGNTSTLAEIWIPGQDGYVLQITKGKHTHKVLNIQR